MKYSLPLTSLVVLLAACGGGGGGGDSSPEPAPSPAPIEALSFTLPDALQAGDAIAIYAQVNNGSDSRSFGYQWHQISGTDLDIANPRAPLAAFELPTSGDYELSLTVTNSIGETYQDNVQFSVAGESDGLNIVRDHMVVEGNRVSLRIQSLAGDTAGEWNLPEDIEWFQTSGPSISPEGNNEPELLTFKAPEVNGDTLLTFEASGTISGQSVSDQVWVLVTNESSLPSEYWLDAITDGLAKPGFSRVQAYRSDSIWASALEKCLYDPQLKEPCKTSELPLIGQLTDTPTVDDIMDRVLVSHPWMGEQFEAFLQQRDPNGDFLALLSAVNGIVLSYDIRPSFYWVGTGAIYLDPDDLWQTPWQRDTINEAADFRSGFGNELQFLIPWRYVKNNQYVSVRYPRDFRIDRPWRDLEPDLASLLYHELAHANDFFPKNTQSSITGDTIIEEWEQRNVIVSDDLTQNYPLNSEEMRALAQVSFGGESVDNGQKALLPSDITALFEPDRANDYYSYSTTREDLAMLFEEAMMQHRYGILRDVAVTGNRSENIEQDLLVDWGQRGRIGENDIAARLQLVLSDLLPDLDSSALLQALGEPVPFRRGETWWDNLELTGGLAAPNAVAPQAFGTGDAVGLRPGLEPRTHIGGRHQVQIPIPKVD